LVPWSRQVIDINNIFFIFSNSYKHFQQVFQQRFSFNFKVLAIFVGKKQALPMDIRNFQSLCLSLHNKEYFFIFDILRFLT